MADSSSLIVVDGDDNFDAEAYTVYIQNLLRSQLEVAIQKAWWEHKHLNAPDASQLMSHHFAWVASSCRPRIPRRDSVSDAVIMPQITSMTWHISNLPSPQEKSHKYLIRDCHYTGLSTSVIAWAIRKTRIQGVRALVLKHSEDECFALLSKVQGCESCDVQNPELLGFVRSYPTTSLCSSNTTGDGWQGFDDDVEMFINNIKTCSEDECGDAFDDAATINMHQWRLLGMGIHCTESLEESHVFKAQVHGRPFLLLNKGFQWMKSGRVEDMNPSRAVNKIGVVRLCLRWLWWDGDSIHYLDQDENHYSVEYGVLSCTLHEVGGMTTLPIWSDNAGLSCPFTQRHFPVCVNEHIAGRRKYVPNWRSLLYSEGLSDNNDDSVMEIEELVDGQASDFGLTWRTATRFSSTTNCWYYWRQCLRLGGRGWAERVDATAVRREWSDSIRNWVDAKTVNHGIGLKLDSPSKNTSTSIADLRAQLWFVTTTLCQDSKPEWWPCPMRVATLISQGFRRIHNTIVRTCLDSTSLATENCLVREVLEQEEEFSAGLNDPKKQWKCWICLDRTFNAEHQFVEHVRGSDGNGSKSHNKFRNRWCANGNPTREVWLNMKLQGTANMNAPNEQGEQPALPLEERVSACESATATEYYHQCCNGNAWIGWEDTRSTWQKTDIHLQ